MAQHLSIQEKAAQLKRRYKHISPDRFLYNKKSELRLRWRIITAWFVIHDEGRGFSIMNMDFRRKERPGVRQWLKGFTRPGIVGEVSLMHVFTQLVLPAINNKGGASWRFKALLAWTGKLDTAKADDSATPKRSNNVKTRGK
jgi:hypothetical protein